MSSTRLTIGSDPELILLDNKEEIVKAGDVIPEKLAPFGVDGHPFIAELRPTAAVHPRDFVSSIRDVLKSRVSSLNQYIWRAGPWAGGRPLGGHIHFGTPFQDSFREALDGQFAPILAMVEPQKEAEQRRTTVFYGSNPYGMLGDIRKKNWGFEYRTPSSFLPTPGLTLGLLTIAKAIIWEELNKGKQAFSQLPTQSRQTLMFNHQDFYHCNRDVFLPKLDTLEKQLSQMLYFEKKQEGYDLWPSVSYILHQVIPKKGYLFKDDLKKKWKLECELDQKYLESLSPIWGELIKNRQLKDWYTKILPETADQFILKSTDSPALFAPKKEEWKPIDPNSLWSKL